jgi:hypothetical protein
LRLAKHVSIKLSKESTPRAADVNRNLPSVPGTQNKKEAAADLRTAGKKDGNTLFLFFKNTLTGDSAGQLFLSLTDPPVL